MKWIAKAADFQRRFEIEHVSSLGFYFNVYEGDTCTYDDLQDTLEWAKIVALEEFNIPKEAWLKVD